VIRICKVDYNNEIDSSLFEKEQEGQLLEVVTSLKSTLSNLYNDKNFSEYLNKLNTLVVPVNNFFENVMVMSEDEKVKNNRLSLLTSIKSFSEVIGNFDKIVL
ncbi:MAG: DALR anticodon-binding domain-containing protein, partial [Candidatus Sericytochromatia bacterium]